MAQLTVSGAGTALMELMNSEDLQPGAAPSYQTCKTIYSYHPLGMKMADSPIKMAQSKPRRISVPSGPEERVREQFEREWKAMGCNAIIRNVGRLSRVYGIASLAVITVGKDPGTPLNLDTVGTDTLAINVLDPLNTAGSFLLVQDQRPRLPQGQERRRRRAGVPPEPHRGLDE